MPTMLLPHSQWETLHDEAESFAENLRSVAESTLVRLAPEERAIYCQHLANLAGYWGFEQQAQDHDRQHGAGCGCADCRSLFGLAF